MAKLAEAFVVIKLDNRLKKGLASVQSEISNSVGKLEAKLSKAARKMAKSIGKIAANAMRKMGNIVTGIFRSLLRSLKRLVIGIVVALGAIGVASIKMASSVEESENLFTVSMGKMAMSARRFSESLEKSLGLFAPEIRKMQGIFNVMLKSLGQSEDAAFAMSAALTKLTFDLSSFFDVAPEIAFQKLQAGLVGEIEPLRRWGVEIGENASRAFAFKNQIGSLTQEGTKLRGELTESQKVMARFGVIMEKTQAAQGDLERTQDALANTTRRLGNAWKRLLESIGKLFTKDLAILFDNMGKAMDKNRVKIAGFIDKIITKVKEWIAEQGGLIVIWEKILIIIDKVKQFIVSNLVPAFNLLLPILTAVAEKFGVIEKATSGAKVSVKGIEGGISAQRGFKGSATKESRRIFGKDPGELRGKQIQIFEAMLDEMKQQTRLQKAEAAGI